MTLSTQKLIPWPRPTISTPIFQPTFCPLSWQMSWLMTASDNSGKFCWPQFKYAENVSRCSQWILFASSRVIKGTWLYKSYLGKDYEVLENYRYGKLSKLRELQSIGCLLLHHIQQSYKKYVFHIRLSALKQGSAPIDSHFRNHGLLVRTAFQASDWEKWEEKRQRLP